MAIAYVQEFTIQDGDTSTTNYDAVNSALDLQKAPDGLLIHTAGFDHDAGVFRIFDVWETREQGEKFFKERLNPMVEPTAPQRCRIPSDRAAGARSRLVAAAEAAAVTTWPLLIRKPSRTVNTYVRRVVGDSRKRGSNIRHERVLAPTPPGMRVTHETGTGRIRDLPRRRAIID